VCHALQGPASGHIAVRPGVYYGDTACGRPFLFSRSAIGVWAFAHARGRGTCGRRLAHPQSQTPKPLQWDHLVKKGAEGRRARAQGGPRAPSEQGQAPGAPTRHSGGRRVGVGLGRCREREGEGGGGEEALRRPRRRPPSRLLPRQLSRGAAGDGGGLAGGRLPVSPLAQIASLSVKSKSVMRLTRCLFLASSRSAVWRPPDKRKPRRVRHRRQASVGVTSH
jgi:hypothetical protein